MTTTSTPVLTGSGTLHTVHTYSHHASKVTVKHVAPKPHHPLTKAQRNALMYG